MEVDNVTRLFSYDGNGTFYQEWPLEPTSDSRPKTNPDKSLTATAAAAVIARADIWLVSVYDGASDTGHWLIDRTRQDTTELPTKKTVLPMKGHGQERYKNLVALVNDIFGKSGVTVLFS